MTNIKKSCYLDYFPEWLSWAEKHWTDIDDKKGYFGSGTGEILAHSACSGYLAACIMVATGPESLLKKSPLSQEALIKRALKAFRFIMKSHLSQDSAAADNKKWGHHWGSPIAIERAANFIDVLKSYMSKDDLSLWHNILIDEANYHLETPIKTNRFSSEGETHAERNYWRGSLLFRAAREIPDHKNVLLWLEKSSQYAINSFSVPDDAGCKTMVDNKPLNERFIGANVHPKFIFEHHGSIGIDYSIHAEAFFTMIMVSILRNNWQTIDALSHHMGDVWNFVRRCILPSGNIAFIGGLQRPRYAISQNYLLPCLLFWHYYGHDLAAKKLAGKVLAIISQLRDESGDGSFYSARGAALKSTMENTAPQYYYRLESDVIISLGLSHMIAQLPERKTLLGPTAGIVSCDEKDLQKPVYAKDAGLVFHRTRRGLFSVNWKRSEQAEADPPLANAVSLSNGHRAEWLSNLATVFKPFRPERNPVDWWSTSFKNGFATAGHIYEGKFLRSDDIPLGYSLKHPGYGIDQRLAFILMPDGRTFVRIEKSNARYPLNISEIASLNLNIANDTFTKNQFKLTTASGTKTINGLGGEDKVDEINTSWVNIADELGVVSLYGPKCFALETFSERQRGYGTLLVERLYYPLIKNHIRVEKGEKLIDTGVILMIDSTVDDTRKIVENMNFQRVSYNDPDVEIITFCYSNTRRAVIVINFSDTIKQIPITQDLKVAKYVTKTTIKTNVMELEPWEIALAEHK